VSQRARIAIIVIAAVGLVIAFFAARGSEDADDPPVGQGATTPAQTSTGRPEGGTEAPAEAPARTTPPAPEIPVVRVRAGKPVGGVQRLDFEEGERVRFRVRADAADEVHVHGYDVTKPVGPGRATLFSFDGELTGRFEVELHGVGAEIASLRVSP